MTTDASETPPATRRKNFVDAPDSTETQIVVIGAGMAGLYTALRLLDHDPQRRITIVERLNRIGGRLQTDLVKIGDDTVREEEGGMRFNYEMTELMNLAKYLGLCGDIVPFPMGTEGDSNRFHVRGRTFTLAEANNGSNRIWGELFDLDEAERGRSPSELVRGAFQRVRDANHDTFAATATRPPDGTNGWGEVRTIWRWKDRTLNQWQLWGLLRDMGYSEECIELISSMNGFRGLFKAQINAGDAFQVLGDFPASPHLFTFEKGFSTLPEAIVDRLEQDHGDRIDIMLSTSVDRFERLGDRFVLSLTEAPEHGNSNPFVPKGTSKTLTADKVVAAVAASGMQQLFRTSPALHDGPDAHRLWENLTAARGMTLTKINLYFEKPWWAVGDGEVTPPVQFGPSFTSLPINSVYPFYSLPQSHDDRLDEAAALTIYCDFDNTHFWAGLQNLGKQVRPELPDDHGTQNDEPTQTMFAASDFVVDEIIRQLKILFTVDSIPTPIRSTYRSWNGEDDFEHAYHQWKVGVDDADVRAHLTAPLDGIYFCNEAISDMQAWVNGSLRSADLVLDEFGVPRMVDDPCIELPGSPTAGRNTIMPGPWS